MTEFSWAGFKVAGFCHPNGNISYISRVLDHRRWKHFYHMPVLEASQQAQADFPSPCQLS